MLRPMDPEKVRHFMESQWREPGFTCPNAQTYPWLWLWDSCFHSLIWAHLGRPDRAVMELRSALASQHRSGFVPHVVYYDGFRDHDDFWRANGTSSITQPPIYGHTVAALIRKGIAVPEELVGRATLGLRFLLEQRRRTPGGLIEIVHPWESGCDHSPRWDSLFDPDGHGYDLDRWFTRKGELVDAVNLIDGSPISSDACAIGSVAFNSLVAFSAFELAQVTGDAHLHDSARGISVALDRRWNPELRTWVDEGTTESGSGGIRTLEALLPMLVDQRDEIRETVVGQLLDSDAFRGEFGFRQVHRAEPAYDPSGYWRGASWPQLNYLMGLALAQRCGDTSLEREGSDRIRGRAHRGALGSGFSEYWDAETGEGGGARPQSWAGLVVVDD